MMSAQTDQWTFALIDLAGFTALTESHGDEQAADLATEFATLAERNLGPNDKLIKTIGDAVLLAAEDPAAGLKLVRGILKACNQADGFPVARAGIHHGPAVIRGNDMFGAAINVTARVAALASGNQVLATWEVAQIARSHDIAAVSVGTVDLKNVSAPVELFDVALLSPSDHETVDPVCRMRVEKAKAAGRFWHQETEYWFCSLECAAAFTQTPDRFAAST